MAEECRKFDWLIGMMEPHSPSKTDWDFCLTPDELMAILENLAKEMAKDAAEGSPEPD